METLQKSRKSPLLAALYGAVRGVPRTADCMAAQRIELLHSIRKCPFEMSKDSPPFWPEIRFAVSRCGPKVAG
jgi:hypothetical protein